MGGQRHGSESALSLRVVSGLALCVGLVWLKVAADVVIRIPGPIKKAAAKRSRLQCSLGRNQSPTFSWPPLPRPPLTVCAL
jgi:hypothetical protein